MKIKFYLILLLGFISWTQLRAQAPVINYSGNQVFNIGTTINSLVPNNSGGAVPAVIYGQVTAFAGSGTAGSANGTGSLASFSGPSGEAVDASGNIYVADATNNLIRKITPQGVVSIYAGNGTAGAVNGSALTASFNAPCAIAINTANNTLFVVDAKNNLIREITTSGRVGTFAGSGAAGFANGSGTLASFNMPQAIAIDASGNVYVTDFNNNAIRKITSAGVVSTFAGGSRGSTDGLGTAAGFSGPTGIGVDLAGNVYVADQYNNLIRKITPGGQVTTLAGSTTSGVPVDGVGTAARFAFPYGLCVDAIGNIYVSDSSNPQIRVVTPTGVVSTLAGAGTLGLSNGIGTAATFSDPYGLAVDGQGHLFVTENLANLVREVSVYGYSINPSLSPGLNFDGTTGIISGKPSVAKTITNYTVNAYNAAGSSTTAFSITVNATQLPQISYSGPQNFVAGIAITPVAPNNSGGAIPANLYAQVSTFAGSGAVGSVNGSLLSSSFNSPFGIAIDPSGNIYVSDQSSNVIRKISSAGVVSTFAGSGVAGATNGTGQSASFNSPGGIVTDASGNLFVADFGNNLIREITPSGVVTTFAGSGLPYITDGQGTQANFDGPSSIKIDAAGNFYVADALNKSIRKITATGLVTTFTRNLIRPEDVVADNDGNLFEADALKVNKINSSGVATAFAGSGVQGVADGQGTTATFGGPYGITIDAANNLYVTDVGINAAVRKITALGLVSTLAGTSIMTGQTVKNGIGSAGTFGNPGGIAIDPSGNLLVADAGFHMIRKVTTTGYIISPALPAGLTMDGTGTISGTPTAASPATTYTITAYNAGGSSTATLSIAVAANTGQMLSQTITFPAFTNSVYGALPIAPTATASSGLPVTYSSSNTNVAIIVAGQIQIVGAGTTNITAVQAGNATYSAAVSQSQMLTVAPALLIIKPDDKSKYFSDPNPVFTFTCNGFVNQDNAASLTTQPTFSTSATNLSAQGIYAINAIGAVSANYSISYQPGTLTVNPAPAPIITSVNQTTAVTGNTITITGTYLYGATGVSFGGTDAASFTVVSPTTITAIIGNGASGNISVTTPSGTGILSGFVFLPIPVINTQGSLTIQSGDSVLLTTSSIQGASYQWFKNGVIISGATSAGYQATQSGAYTVQIGLGGLTQTSTATTVNVIFSLPSNNFTIINTGETCRGASDGSVHITAIQHLNYTVSVNNVPYNFTDSLTVSNLSSGNYNVCLSVAGQPFYEQCFTSVITQPQDLSVYAAVSAKTNQVLLTLTGGNKYVIKLNGVSNTTTDNQVTLNLQNGTNTIEVTTDKLCQGDILKTIIIANLRPYPNPFSTALNIDLGTDIIKNTTATIYDLNNRVVYTSSFFNQSGVIQLGVSGLNSGVYVLKLSTDNKNNIFKLVKK